MQIQPTSAISKMWKTAKTRSKHTNKNDNKGIRSRREGAFSITIINETKVEQLVVERKGAIVSTYNEEEVGTRQAISSVEPTEQ